jgi:hypothetical protein
MSTQHISIDDLRARLQEAIVKTKRPRQLPRLFELTYDRTKLKSRNPVTRLDYQVKLTLWGTDYPPTDLPSGVGLQNGTWFRDVQELRDHFEAMGEYDIIWHDVG